MRFEPCVNALKVEAMATLGKNPKAFALSELREANRTLRVKPVPSLVLADRDSADERFIQPIRRRKL